MYTQLTYLIIVYSIMRILIIAFIMIYIGVIEVIFSFAFLEKYATKYI
jgi:hypothetical protein